MITLTTKALAWTAGGLLLAWSGAENVPQPPAEFAPPTRLKAGEKYMGQGRLYPSPVVREVNGRREVVVGDLIGNVTVAPLSIGEAGVSAAAEEPLNMADGKPLKFHNW